MKFNINYTLPDLTKMSVVFNGNISKAISRVHDIDVNNIMEDEEGARFYDLNVNLSGKQHFIARFTRAVPDADLDGDFNASFVTPIIMLKDVLKNMQARFSLVPINIKFSKDTVVYVFECKFTRNDSDDNFINLFNESSDITLEDSDYSWMKGLTRGNERVNKIERKKGYKKFIITTTLLLK